MKNGMCRSLDRRLTAVHKVLCIAGEIEFQGCQDFYLGSDGGGCISEIGELVRKTTAHSSQRRRQHRQFKRAWQSSKLVSPTKTLNTDLAPSSDDIEPVQVLREDVEMANDEDEEPLEAEVPRARMNPNNPTSRERQEDEDSGHAVYRNWCAACVEGRGVGGQHRRIVGRRGTGKDDFDRSFRLRFSDTGKRRHFQF